MLNVKMKSTEVQKLSPKITVVGVGGAGGNAVNNMIASNLEGVEFLVCNSDAQALEGSLAENKVQLGAAITGGLGAGSQPDVGRAAAEETLNEVLQYLEGSNMAFITAGMGGGTGTGAAPVIARAAREQGILTVGVVTKPFHFEGAHRMRSAEQGIEEMQDYVDTLIVIPNQNLFRIANEKTTFADAFKMADGVLQSGVRGVTDLMVMPGLINLDFADIRCAMLEMGKAMMGTGEASGDRRSIEAAEAAINNPLLDDVSMKGARGVLINVTGGFDMTLFEVDEACNRIRDEVDADANIIFGSTFDEKLDGMMRVSVVATGIEAEAAQKGKPSVFGYNKSVTERAVPNASQEQQVAAQKSPAESQAAVSETQVQEQQTAPQQWHSTDAVRGSRQGSAFIPPQPVDPRQEELAPQSQPVQQPVTETQVDKSVQQQEDVVVEEQMQTKAVTGGYSLNPPVPGAQKKRTASLFERFTGVGRSKDEDDDFVEASETQGEDETSSGSAGGGLRATKPVSQGEPSRQGSLDIDAGPSKSASVSEDDLDIPAFLRRQAN